VKNILRLLSVAACLICIIAVSCGEFSKPIVPQITEPILFDDYVRFDTSRFMIQRSTIGLGWVEWYLSCESSLGEPFTDVNGNGVYDPGIDIFVMAVGPENMDYNHNGKHDGPDDPWEPGIPFDDHNGDGERSCYSLGWYPERHYETWMPFCDLNGNGRWDSLSNLRHKVVKWGIVNEDSTGVEYQPVENDSLFWYTTDSGVQHWQPEPHEWPDSNSNMGFILDDSGLIGTTAHTWLRLLYYGNNTVDTTRMPRWWSGCGYVTLRKTVHTDQDLEIYGVLHQDLLMVRFDQPRGDSGQDVSRCENDYWEFYFAKGTGLIAGHFDVHQRLRETWYYYDRQFDSAPILMTPAEQGP